MAARKKKWEKESIKGFKKGGASKADVKAAKDIGKGMRKAERARTIGALKKKMKDLPGNLKTKVAGMSPKQKAVVGAALVAAAAASSAVMMKKRAEKKYAPKCAAMKGQQKADCLKAAKKAGLEQAMKQLKADAAMCSGASNPEKCKQSIEKKMIGYKKQHAKL